MMKKISVSIVLITIAFASLQAQTARKDSGTFWHPVPASYQAKQAFEVESLFSMFFTGGFHFALGYRYEQFRVRISVINGGKYDAETAGINNSSDNFKRYYKTSPGVFLGYNVWRNLEIYTYLEFHTFQIEQKATGLKQNLHSTDCGAGISYQFFIGKYVYLQPGMHIYLRKDKSLDFNGVNYSIPNVDLSPVIRVGIRLWQKDKYVK